MTKVSVHTFANLRLRHVILNNTTWYYLRDILTLIRKAKGISSTAMGHPPKGTCLRGCDLKPDLHSVRVSNLDMVRKILRHYAYPSADDLLRFLEPGSTPEPILRPSLKDEMLAIRDRLNLLIERLNDHDPV